MSRTQPTYGVLTPLEVATSYLTGHEEPEILDSRGGAPLEALQRAILPALLRPPCIVAFSGGRDSSAVLAVATQLARREGLAEPVALTRRWPAYPATDETAWQELVVSHLGVEDWVRVDLDESDLVGPTARASLKKEGCCGPRSPTLGFLCSGTPPEGRS